MSEEFPIEDFEETGTIQEAPPNPSSVQSVRFGLRELRLVREAARRAGVSTSEFIREAAMARAVGVVASPQITWGAPQSRESQVRGDQTVVSNGVSGDQNLVPA